MEPAVTKCRTCTDELSTSHKSWTCKRRRCSLCILAGATSRMSALGATSNIKHQSNVRLTPVLSHVKARTNTLFHFKIRYSKMSVISYQIQYKTSITCRNIKSRNNKKNIRIIGLIYFTTKPPEIRAWIYQPTRN